MMKIQLKPLAIATFASAALFGCASSNNSTAMDDNVNMSETQTMAGDTESMENADAVVVTTEISRPIATIPLASLSLVNEEELDEMFDEIDETEQYNFIELAQKSPNLSTFVQLVEAAGMTESLKRDGGYTVFAPTNEAFSKLSKQELEMLLLPENRSQLIDVLKVHVLPTEVGSLQLSSSHRIELSEDKYIPVRSQLNGTQMLIGGAALQVTDVEASNGLLHVVDNVILPSNYSRSEF